LTGLNNEIHAEDLTEIARSIAKALDKDEGARRIEALDIVR
jgi:tetrahydromethanopterin S-methyltransferase subunit A